MPIGQMIGALISESARQKMSQEQMNILRDALTRIRDIPLPVLEKAQAEELGRPEAAAADPAALAAQRAALERMSRWGEGEVTPEDRAQLALAQSESARRGAIQQNAIQQALQSRGLGGSGAEYAMRQQAAQGANEEAYKAAIQNMLANRQRAFQATGAQGQMSSQMQNEAFRRKAAADAAAQYNAGARQRVQGYNIGLPQQQFANQLRQAQAAAGQTSPLVGQMGQEAAGQGAFWSNMGAAGQSYMDKLEKESDESKSTTYSV